MFIQGVSKNTKGNLALLGNIAGIKDFYLAGGSACALHIGHRLSFDLDFFSQKNFNVKTLRSQIEELGKFYLEQESTNTLLAKLNNVRISFFTYKYPLIFPTQKFQEINVADIRDVACMKLDAISSRGTKRDFIDLYFICQQNNLDLEKIFQLFGKKYKEVEYNLFHIIKSLTYFEDAEGDEMPKMLKPVSWNELKKFFEKTVRDLNL